MPLKQNTNRPNPFVEKPASTGAIVAQHTGQREAAHEFCRQRDHDCVGRAILQRREQITDNAIKIATRTPFSRTQRRPQLRIGTSHRPQLQFGEIGGLRKCISQNARRAIDRIGVVG